MNAHGRYEQSQSLLSRIAELEAENRRLRAEVDRHEALFRGGGRLTAIAIATCEHFGVAKDRLVGRGKTYADTLARQVFAYLCRTETDMSSPVIGNFLKRDHTSVLHGAKRISRMVRNGHEVIDDIDAIRARLKAGRAA